MAIQGYGAFSKLLVKYLSAEQYQTLCLEIVSCTGMYVIWQYNYFKKHDLFVF